ncbi:Ankyrin repeat and SOCS box protein 11 [Daphnia magna]|uniref:Ankyrin repeat and SOCS box protein 11 n=2 Tax=Daphnia magna TaxID=35525 RepID=A0A165AH99_9CRUS|nr:Ankyrin repeat and SOCS box protein 11 [Daphnia magna]
MEAYDYTNLFLKWLGGSCFAFSNVCSFQHESCIEFGLQHILGSSRTEKMRARISPAELHLVVKIGQVQEVSRLLAAGGDPDAIYRGITLLGTAISSQDKAMVQVLLSAGADASVPSHGSNGRLEPPLYTACRLKDDELAEMLIRAGADLNASDFYGHTPLWVATKGQRPLLVAKLLAAGSRLGSTEDYSWSQCPLYLATKYLGYRGRHQLAMFLMAAGADPTRMDSKGRSAIYWSLRNRDHDLFVFMIDSYNPRCWDSMLQRRVEELLTDLPDTHLKILQKQWYNPPSLAKQCRLVIRLHLLQKFNYRSLFLLVPRLPLPTVIQRFLLLDQELPDEETTPCFMKDISIKT